MSEPLTVVVCGASAGVGRATAVAFAQAGYRVGLLARSAAGLREAEAEVRAQGAPAAMWIAADVADAEAVERAAERFEAELGPLDVWVNAAMATVFSPVERLSAEEIARVTEVTYLGTVHGTLAALKRMQPRNRGTIVQVGSALAYRAIPLQAAYCGAKFAIRGFTDALRCELLHDRSGVRLTMVQIPAQNTPQFDWARNHLGRRAQPVPPIYQPEATARAILRAARTAPRELWLGGSTLKAILATLVAPGLVDRVLARQGYTGQVGEEIDDPQRPDNLFAPVEGLHATAGRFVEQARPDARGVTSTQVGAMAAVGLAALLVGAAWLGRSRR